jgi:hypothetical protein
MADMEERFKGEGSRTASGNGLAAREAAEIAHVGPKAPPRYYSTGEAGQILGIDPRRVRQLLKAGELEESRDPQTGHWRVDQRSVHARVKDHPASSEAASTRLSEPTPTTDLERQVAAINTRLEKVEERVQADRELERQRADLERRWADLERERAELLERKLEAERSKGFFGRIFGG